MPMKLWSLQKNKGLQKQERRMVPEKKEPEQPPVQAFDQDKESIDPQEIEELHRSLERIKEGLKKANEQRQKETIVKEEQSNKEQPKITVMNEELKDKLNKIRKFIAQQKKNEKEEGNANE